MSPEELIIPSEHTHPYGVKASLVLGNNVELGLENEEARLRFGRNHAIRLLRQASPGQNSSDVQRFVCHLEAFTTASEAERAGKMFVSSLLWIAASKKITIGFDEWTGNFPFAIRNRTISAGMTCHGTLRVFQKIDPEEFVSIAGTAFDRQNDLPPNILTSMQFFASARLESTDRARFVNLVTALEAFCKPAELEPELRSLTEELIKHVNASTVFSDEKTARFKVSFLNRVRHLKTESIRQAIIRTVREHVTDPDVIEFVDKAYDVRSKLLHAGDRPQGLSPLMNELEDLLRRLYSSVLDLPLARPIPVN
jgi:hypothetical protein